MKRTSHSHGMTPIPAGKAVQDILYQYAEVTRETAPIGKPCPFCAGCSKPFSATRQPSGSLRIYPAEMPVPVAYLYFLCGRCTRQYRFGGSRSDAILAAVKNFMMGDEVAHDSK